MGGLTSALRLNCSDCYLFSTVNPWIEITVKIEDKCIKYTSDRLKAKSPLPESKKFLQDEKAYIEVKEHVMFVIKPSYLNNLYF